MAGSPATLSIKIVSDASDATKDFQGTARAASDMGDTVDAASKQVATAARRMDGAADAADNLGGEAGKATGALGALSSGFELVGLEKYAAGLQSAAMATDFVSGAGDALNLVMESQALKWIKNTALTIKDTVVKGAAAAATGVMTAAQWAMNAAMAASPVLLVVAGVAALVAVIVLAWKRSETFRKVVTGAFEAIKDAAAATFGWVKSNWPLLLAIITGPIGLAVLAVVKNWDAIKAAVVSVKEKIGAAFDRAGELVKNAFEDMKAAANAVADFMTAPFRAVVDVVKEIIDWIKKIPKPDLGVVGDVLGKGGDLIGSVLGRGRATTTPVAPASVTNVNVNVTGAIDPMATGRQIVDLLADYLRSTGTASITIGSTV